MFNRVFLVGRVKAKPDYKHTSTGKNYVYFHLATEAVLGSGKDRRRITEWHKIVAWGRLAEICAEYLEKGSLILIEGRLTTRSWENDGRKHYSTEIVADKMRMLGGGRGQEAEETAYSEEDLPF